MAVRICGIEECGKITRGRKLCEMHYYRFRRHGNHTVNKTEKGIDWKIRFKKRIMMSTPDKCWQWTGKPKDTGYGYISIDGIPVYAHRASLLYFTGKKDGDHVDHLCRNKLCVNPRHLEVVTLAVNSMRGNAPSIENYFKDVCRNGHKLTKKTVWLKADLGRVCRECQRIWGKRKTKYRERPLSKIQETRWIEWEARKAMYEQERKKRLNA